MNSRPVLKLKRAEAPAPIAPPEAAHVPAPSASSVPLERFWFIWCPQSDRAPRKRHGSLEAALAESQRLKKIAPERGEFPVYCAIVVAPPVDVQQDSIVGKTFT